MAARLTTYVVVAIVAVTLIAGLIVGAQRDDNSGPVDLIIHNAKVAVGDAPGKTADAVAIRGNKILRVGSERDVMRRRLPQTEIVDAKGAAVLPGLSDSHVSLVERGLALDGVDLSGATTVDDVVQRVAEWAATHPDAAWITGRDWAPDAFTGVPTHVALDLREDKRPVLLLSTDGASAWINMAALRQAHITRRTSGPQDGEIVRDRHGEPTGILTGTAIELVKKRMPPATKEERARALRAAVEEAHARGITSVEDLSTSPDDADVYADARQAGDLKLRVDAPPEQRKATIKPGMLADLIVRSHDVDVTIFDGKIVYKRKPTL